MDEKPDRRTLVATAICVAVLGAMCLSTLFGAFAIRSTEPTDVARELLSTLLIFSVLIASATLSVLFLLDYWKVIRLSPAVRHIAGWAWTVVGSIGALVLLLDVIVGFILWLVGKWPPG